MAEIKVGQKWKLVNGSVQAGHVAEITSVTEDYVYYRPGLYFPDGDWKNISFLSNWELVEEESELEIKVGQKYRFEGRDWGNLEGTLTTITGISGERIDTAPSGWDTREMFFATEADLISSHKTMGYVLAEDVEVEEVNQLSPNAYQFPDGVEVRHISAHLSSFGGQAVQYIARATRLDGVVKGLPVQDLKKAIQLLEWEVVRLES